MNKARAQAALDRMIRKIRMLFYHDLEFLVGGSDAHMVATITAVVRDPTPNSNLAPVTESTYGVEVTSGLLAVPDDTAVEFALCHELGHAFSETVLREIGLAGASGPVTEVIADLGAAYVLAEIGVDWERILTAVDNGTRLGIFDRGREGHHPPGARRAEYVRELHALLVTRKLGFTEAAASVCSTVPGE